MAGGGGGRTTTGRLRRARIERCVADDCSVDIPFEFVSEVAGTSAMAETGNVECGSSTRHGDGQ